MQKLSTLVVSTLLLIGTGLSQTLQRSTGMYRQRPEISVVKETAKSRHFQKQETVLKTPFVENFSNDNGEDGERLWQERWTIFSSPNAFEGYGGLGCIHLSSVSLVSKPIEIIQGKTHICLYAKYKGKATDSVKLLLWYGKSQEIAEMKLIDSIRIDSTNFTQVLRYFDVAEDGKYYVALQPKKFGRSGSLLIDALEIASGDYVARPVLSVSELQAPMPGCEGKAGIKFIVGNQGSEDTHGFGVNYTVNNGAPVILEFKDTIKAGEFKQIEVTDIPLPADGANHIKISASEYPFLAGTQTAYNYLFTPPHTFNFSKYEMIDKAGIDDGSGYLFPTSWQSLTSYSSEGVEVIDSIKMTRAPESPFMSGCITLETNAVYEITFDCRGGLDGGVYLQRGKLLIGKAGSDWTTWDIIWHDSLVPVNWQSKKVEVSVPQSGEYAIAFIKAAEPGVSIMGKPGGSDSEVQGLQIQNVAINRVQTPKIWLDAVIVPQSACDLEEEIELSFVCTNTDTLPVKGFYAWYSINDTLRVEEFFDTVLKPKVATTLSFNKLSLPSGNNKIRMDISGGNSCRERWVSRWVPAQTPYTIDFNNGDVVGEYGWYIEPYSWTPGAPADHACGHNEMSPLKTRCFSFKSNTSYKIKFSYHGGSIFRVAQRYIPDECMMFVYPVGGNWRNGERIWYEPEVLSDDILECTEVEFKVKTDGEYAFAFALGNSSYQGFYVQDVHISEVLDYDVHLLTDNDFAPLMPLDQLNAPAATNFSLINRGRKPLDKVRVEALLNTLSVGQTEISGVTDTTQGQIEVNIQNMKPGNIGSLKFQASITGHEAEDINPDHEVVYSFTATDTIMAYYRADTIGGAGIGYNDGSIGNGIGMPFVFRVQDTLTSISVGWAASPLGLSQDIQLVIYGLDQDFQTLKEVIWSAVVQRDPSVGWCTYKVPDLKLYGTYFVEVVQASVYNYAIGTEETNNEPLYLHYANTNKIVKSTGYGTPAIRLNLGHHGKPSSSKDIAAEKFIEPYISEGAFPVNQPIRVKIQNLGSDVYPSAKVYCQVNGQSVGKTEVSLRPYMSEEAIFTADLSAPETTYEICVFTALPEDGNRSNDTIRMTLHTLPAADPYVMDFEHCSDFAIADFVPAWTTVDEDGDHSYGWEGLSFPHQFEPFGFIAFNPYGFTPAIDMEQSPEIAPYQGQRFGASFGCINRPASDWLISPKLKMPADARMSFYVKSFTNQYGYDQYEVKVSETDNQLASFKTIGNLREAPSWKWTEVKVDLSEYSGKEIYVAINRTQQEETNAGFLFMIDDIRIYQSGVGNQTSDLAQSLSLYPNPARNEIYVFAAGMEMEKVEIFNLGGQKVFATAQNFHQNGFRLNVANYQPGIYFARVQAAGKQAVLRFSVIH